MSVGVAAIFDLECTACGKQLTAEEIARAVDSDGRRMMCCPKPECMHPTIEVALASCARTDAWLERAAVRLLEMTPTKGVH